MLQKTKIEWVKIDTMWSFAIILSNLCLNFNNKYVICEIPSNSSQRNNLVKSRYPAELYDRIKTDIENDTLENTISLGIYPMDSNGDVLYDSLCTTLSIKSRGRVEDILNNINSSFQNEDKQKVEALKSVFLKTQKNKDSKQDLYFEFSRFASLEFTFIRTSLSKVVVMFLHILKSRNYDLNKLIFFSNCTREHFIFYERMFKKIINLTSVSIDFKYAPQTNIIIYEKFENSRDIFLQFREIEEKIYTYLKNNNS